MAHVACRHNTNMSCLNFPLCRLFPDIVTGYIVAYQFTPRCRDRETTLSVLYWYATQTKQGSVQFLLNSHGLLICHSF